MVSRIFDVLNSKDEFESTQSAAVEGHHLEGEGFEGPSGEVLSHGLRPQHTRAKIVNLEDWPHEVKRHVRDRNLMPRLAEHEMALIR